MRIEEIDFIIGDAFDAARGRGGGEGDAIAVGRREQIGDLIRSGGEDARAGRFRSFGLRLPRLRFARRWAAHGRGFARLRRGLVGGHQEMRVDGGVHVESGDHVAAFGLAILQHVLPLPLVVVAALLAPGLARGEPDGLGVGAPAEGVHALFPGGEGEGFAAIGGDQIELRRFPLVVLVGGLVRIFVKRQFAVGGEGDPFAIWRPFGSSSCPLCVNCARWPSR